MLIRLDIAGIHTGLEIADSQMALQIHSRYAEFIATSNRLAVVVRVQIVPDASFVPRRPGPWVIEAALENERMTYRSYHDAGWVDLERGEGLLEIVPGTEIENFLRVLYAHLCLRENGLLLHAAGVIRDHAGYVFFGPSGSGKTTISRLSLDHQVLSDDLVIIKKENDRYRVFGVPFRGDFPEAPRTNLCADLHGIFALVKDTEHRVAPMPAYEAVARLSACVPFVMAQPACARRAADTCADVAAKVPVRVLHFRRDAGFWSHLLAALQDS